MVRQGYDNRTYWQGYNATILTHGTTIAIRYNARPAALAVLWRGVRVAEGAALEMLYTGNRIGGSNPPLSAFTVLTPFIANEQLFLCQVHP